MATEPARVLRFGTFEVDAQTGGLRKAGLEIRVQEQPRQVLLALLERPGQVVSREELRQRLWPDGTFVDFEHSLNTAVKKLRDALGDAADNPQFIETVPLRGYRFVGPVAREGGGRHQAEVLPGRRSRRWIALAAGAAVLAGMGVSLWWASRPAPVPRLVGSAQLTHSGRVLAPDRREFFPGLATDGARVFFSEISDGGGTRLAQVSAAGGEVLPIPLPFPGGQVLHISPDGARLLVRKRFSLHEKEGPLWVVPTLGGAPHRLGGVVAHDAAWSPAGERIVYAHGKDLFLAKPDGGESHKLASTGGRAVWPRWSPDGTRIRFTVVNGRTNERSIWEVSAEGTDLHPLVVGRTDRGDECCGEWTPDGRHFLFQAFREGRTDVWIARDERALFGRGAFEPIRLTPGPLEFGPPVPSRDGRRVFVVAGQPRTETLRYDLSAREFKPYEHPGLPGAYFTYSGDGEWVAYVERKPDVTSLWRSRIDGSQRVQLTRPPLRLMVPRWSPDGRRIAFMGKYQDEPWKIYSVEVEGGDPEEILEEGRNQADPNWSPDGHSVIFGRPPDYFAEPGEAKAIHLLDLRSKELATLAGSEGLFSPRWSPDGRFVAAMTLDQTKLMLLDFATGKWSELAGGQTQAGRPFHANLPTWSRDGRMLYFQNGEEEGTPIYRVRMSDRMLERIADLGDVKRRVLGFLFTSLAVDGSPIVLCNQADSDIYALEWDAR